MSKNSEDSKGKTKFFWFGKYFFSICLAKELFYTTSKTGSKAYYFFRIGYQDITIENNHVIAPILTLLFLEISVGKMNEI